MREQHPAVDLEVISCKLLAMRSACRKRSREELRAARPERNRRFGGPIGATDFEDTSELVHFEIVRLNDRTCRAIDQALERIREGTYGVCQECGEEISPRRLAYVPEATLCVSCKEFEESRASNGRHSETACLVTAFL